MTGTTVISEVVYGDTFIAWINGTNDDIYHIYCNSTDICKIGCQSSSACTKLYLHCFGTCYVDCDEENGIDCPFFGVYLDWVAPTTIPTTVPTPVPTTNSTAIPTTVPTEVPTGVPTTIPTSIPTVIPTTTPTAIPTTVPTASATSIATAVPTTIPTAVPTLVLTAAPTAEGNKAESSIGGLNLDNINSAASGIIIVLDVAMVVCFFVILFCFGKKLIWKTSITSENRAIRENTPKISELHGSADKSNEDDTDANDDVEIVFENEGEGDGDEHEHGDGHEENGYEVQQAERGESEAQTNVGELVASSQAPTGGINSVRYTVEGNHGEKERDDISDDDAGDHDKDIQW